MPTHVALLRGINVGGNNKVPMADLRAVVASLGHTDVATYIQSGNVVFTPAGPEPGGPDALASELEQAIATALRVQPRVVVVTREELAEVVRVNPYPGEPDHRKLHAVFYPGAPDPGTVDRIDGAQRKAAERGSRDEATLVGRTLFLHTPDGFGNSELAKRLFTGARGAMVTGTARNWATVRKLLDMCGR